MKRLLVFSWCISTFFLLVSVKKTFCRESETHMDSLYKQIGNQLVSIKKEYPACQSKIYLVLDQVDKMYNLAKTKNQQTEHLKETLKTKELENGTLQNEFVTVKNALDTTQAKLEATIRSLEQEKKLVAKLTEEKRTLLAKKQTEHEKKATKELTPQAQDNTLSKQAPQDLSDFETQIAKGQSLNLTSTSEPNSPR